MKNLYIPSEEIPGIESGYFQYSGVRSLALRSDNLCEDVSCVYLDKQKQKQWANFEFDDLKGKSIHIEFARCRDIKKIALFSSYLDNFFILKKEVYNVIKNSNLNPDINLTECEVFLKGEDDFFVLFTNGILCYDPLLPETVTHKSTNYSDYYEISYTGHEFKAGGYDVEINNLGVIIFSMDLAKKICAVDPNVHFDAVLNKIL